MCILLMQDADCHYSPCWWRGCMVSVCLCLVSHPHPPATPLRTFRKGPGMNWENLSRYGHPHTLTPSCLHAPLSPLPLQKGVISIDEAAVYAERMGLMTTGASQHLPPTAKLSQIKQTYNFSVYKWNKGGSVQRLILQVRRETAIHFLYLSSSLPPFSLSPPSLPPLV